MRVLAERDAGDREIEPVELGGAHRGLRDREVRDRRRIERPRVDAAAFARAHSASERSRPRARSRDRRRRRAPRRASTVPSAREPIGRASARTGPTRLGARKCSTTSVVMPPVDVLGGEVDERRDRAAVQDAPRVAQRFRRAASRSSTRRRRSRRAIRGSTDRGPRAASPASSTSGRLHSGGPFSGTRIADVSTPSTHERVARALVVDLDRGQHARASLAQDARVDPERSDVRRARRCAPTDSSTRPSRRGARRAHRTDRRRCRAS